MKFADNEHVIGRFPQGVLPRVTQAVQSSPLPSRAQIEQQIALGGGSMMARDQLETHQKKERRAANVIARSAKKNLEKQAMSVNGASLKR